MEPAERIIARRGLAPLPREGGWFRRTANSSGMDGAGRPAWSEIDYLMTPAGFSAMHRLKADETWSFLDGAPAELLLLGPGRSGQLVRLGPGGAPAVRIPAGTWQGARPLGAWTLCVCRVEPAWCEDFFELADAARLAADFPEWADAIRARAR